MELDVQLDVVQLPGEYSSSPRIDADGVLLTLPKLSPEIVTHALGVTDGPFTGFVCDTDGASNEKDVAAVPAIVMAYNSYGLQ